jgi:hypothetical protein
MKNFQNKTKIIKVSKILRSILFGGLVLEIMGFPVILTSTLIQIFDQRDFNYLPHYLGLPERYFNPSFYLACGTLLWILFIFIVNLKLFRFFDRLKNGHLFDAQTVGNLDAAGKWWIVFWLFEGVFYQIGNEVFQMKAVWDSGGLFAGLTLIFVAWLLKEAQELQEEQELTV